MIINSKRNTDRWLGRLLNGVKESQWTKHQLHIFVVHITDWFIPGDYGIMF